MGAKAGRAEKGLRARVVELLPRATYRLELEDRRRVLAHAAGSGQRNFVRVRVGETVEVVLSPHDTTRGRITRLIVEPRARQRASDVSEPTKERES